ncbi:MAG: CCDC90 family protein [Magnetococcus sp. MYC-9]
MTVSVAIPFDTLAFVKKLETAGVPSAQAEAQVEMLSDVLQKVEESRLQELATKGDVLRLEKEIETAKTELKRDMKEMELRMVIKMGAMILASVGMIIGYLRAFPMPVQIVPSPAQEMRQQAPAPSPATPTPPAH